jgi:hypothetical protein
MSSRSLASGSQEESLIGQCCHFTRNWRSFFFPCNLSSSGTIRGGRDVYTTFRDCGRRMRTMYKNKCGSWGPTSCYSRSFGLLTAACSRRLS